MLREPTRLDWCVDPLDTLAVGSMPHGLAYEHWFELALRRKEQDKAFEISDRIRRHRFFSTQPLGGRVLALRWVLEDTLPMRPRVDLLLALPRPKVMRRLWAQLAAMGVRQIILTHAEKVERDYFDSHILEPQGYRPLLLEGLQQAKDTRLPTVLIHKQFRKLVERDLHGLFPHGRRIVAHPGAGAKTIAETVHGSREGGSPEGRPYIQPFTKP